MEENPLVTIGIPTFNRYKHLMRCIEYATRQTYDNLEILISDNTFEVDTPIEIKNLISNDKRINYIKQKRNIGAIANHAFVLNLSKGDYFCYFHDDDDYPLDHIEKLVSVFSTDEGLSMVGPICKRNFNGKFWYEYERFDSSNISLEALNYDLIRRSFENPWSFEHFFYAMFKPQNIPKMFDFSQWRSIIVFFYINSLYGKIKTHSNLEIIKNTTSSEVDKYSKAAYVKRYKLLELLMKKEWEEKLTVAYRLIKFTWISKKMPIQKLKLTFLIAHKMMFSNLKFRLPPKP